MSSEVVMSKRSIVLWVLLVLSSPAAHTQQPNGSADARLRALYTDEWNWRQKELARSGDQAGDASDRFPKIDAASQQARLAYWTKTLAALDAIPFDQLSPEENVNAHVFVAVGLSWDRAGNGG